MKHTSAINRYAYYVHYYASSFVKQQALPDQNQLSNYVVQRVRSMSGNLKSGISKSVKEEYAQTISALYGRETTDSVKLTSTQITGLQAILSDILENQVTQFTSKDKIEWGSGRVLNGEPQGAATVKGQSKKSSVRYLTEKQVQDLNTLITNVTIEVTALLKQGRGNEEKIQNLRKSLQAAALLLSSVEQKGMHSLKEYAETDARLKTLANVNQDILRYDLGRSGADILRELNKNIVLCKMQDTVLTTAQGTLGEDIAAIAADVVAGKGIEEIQKTIKNSVVGSQQSRIEWNIKGMPAEVYSQFLLQDTKYRKGNTAYSKYGSQGKVDVIVELPVEQKVKEFKKVNISMKSVDLSRDIHIVSGTNLWYLIQNENVKHFLRPYLNILADHMHASDPNFTPRQSIAKEYAAIRQVRALQNDALIATKILTAYKALSGNTYGRTAAQLFVVNDVVGKKTYVLEINDIIKAILNQIQLSKSAIDHYFTFEGLDDNLTFKNNWQDTLDHRMAQLLMDIRQRKLFISMRNVVITSNMVKTMAIG